MTAALALSIIDWLLGSTLGAVGQGLNSRVSLDGFTWGAREDGAFEIGIRRLELASLRMESGPHVLEIGKLVLVELVALVRVEGSTRRLSSLKAAAAELSGFKVQGPVPIRLRAGSDSTVGPLGPASWHLGPLAAAEGSIRAEIVDAHLLFDAEVTVPIRQGGIDFKDATVEHVGPDSRMGVSRLGLYVDAPNGRSYLYQFSSPPVAGVKYEQRGALLGPFVTNRGSLRLQPFGEWLVHQPLGGQAHGVTEQARRLFERTAVSGDVQLGDGRFTAPAAQAEFVGRADGHNAIRLSSQAVGQGLTVEMASLSARDAALGFAGTRIECGQIGGALRLGLAVEGAQWRFSLELGEMRVSAVRFDSGR